MTEIMSGMIRPTPPCPFCGGEPKLDQKTSLNVMSILSGDSSKNTYRAHCSDCGLSMPWSNDLTEAFTTWRVCVQALQTADGTPIKDLTIAQLRKPSEPVDPSKN